MRLVFMGTPEFAVPSLELLHSSKHEIISVVTAPDRPKGRGRKIQQSEVKKTAVGMGLPLLQPDNLKDPEFVEQVRELNPDLIAVVAFRILPESVYTIPSKGAINLHASLLPAYRGAAPINWCLINGETETGVTTFYLKKKVDTGDLLMQKSVPITLADDFGSLHDKLMLAGADVLMATVDGVDKGSLEPIPQDNSKVSQAPKIDKDTCRIDWSKSAEEVANLVRGLSPMPAAFTMLAGKQLKVLRAEIVKNKARQKIASVISSDTKDGIVIQCGKDAVRLLKIKPEGKKIMSSADFVKGFNVEIGQQFAK